MRKEGRGLGFFIYSLCNVFQQRLPRKRVFQCNLPSQLGMQLLLFLLVLYLLANTVAAGSLRPELQFPNVSSHVAALVAVPSECVPPGSAPALVHTRHNSARFVHCLCGGCLSLPLHDTEGLEKASFSPCRMQPPWRRVCAR